MYWENDSTWLTRFYEAPITFIVFILAPFVAIWEPTLWVCLLKQTGIKWRLPYWMDYIRKRIWFIFIMEWTKLFYSGVEPFIVPLIQQGIMYSPDAVWMWNIIWTILVLLLYGIMVYNFKMMVLWLIWIRNQVGVILDNKVLGYGFTNQLAGIRWELRKPFHKLDMRANGDGEESVVEIISHQILWVPYQRISRIAHSVILSVSLFHTFHFTSRILVKRKAINSIKLLTNSGRNPPCNIRNRIENWFSSW